MSESVFLISLRNSIPCVKSEISSKRRHPSPEELQTLELKEKILFSTIWRVKVKSCKLCATSTTTRVYKVLLMFILNSEEAILSAWSVSQVELKEVSFQFHPDKSSSFLRVSTCCPRFMSVSRTNNQDTERDI